MKKVVYVMFLILLIISSCTSSRTIVNIAPESKFSAKSITLVEGKHTVKVPEEVVRIFRDKLEIALFGNLEGKPPIFTKGDDLIISYKFIQFNPGSRFKRWLSGGIGGYGEGSITVEVTYLKQGKIELAKIQAEGKIGAGIFGGSIEEAISKCVEEIVNYTKTHFR